MSVLFVGPYRQPDEWGKRSLNLLQSLKKTNIDITARPLFLASFPTQTDKEETEYTRFDNYDILIQHTLPMYFIADKSFKKNIGVIELETIDMKYNGWLYKLNFVDEIWVNSNVVKEYLEKEFPTKTIRNIQNSLDTSVIENIPNEKKLEGLDPNRFKFYFMGDTNPKNGIEELIIAYYRSFTKQDQVQLILFFPGVAPESFQPIFHEAVPKAGTLYDVVLTPLVHVVNTPLDPSHTLIAHRECDCMVSPSYMFAAQNFPLEAAIFGNNPIITKGTGTAEILTDQNAWLIDSYEESCAVPGRPFPDVFTAHETIRKPIIKSLSYCMKEAYNNKYIRDKKKLNSKALLQSLSHETAADTLKDYICIR